MSSPSQAIPVTTEQLEAGDLERKGSQVDMLKKQCASKDVSCNSSCFLNKSRSHRAHPGGYQSVEDLINLGQHFIFCGQKEKA